MKRALAIVLVLLGVGLVGQTVMRGGAAAAGQEGPMPWPAVAERIRQGAIDVGGTANKAYGMAEERRYHRIHSDVLGLECDTCHVDQVSRSVAIFMLRPAVDVSSEAPAPVDRRVCQGCHLAGPGRTLYGPRTP